MVWPIVGIGDGSLLGAIAVLFLAVMFTATLGLSRSLRVWVLYPLMMAVGLSWVVDLTSRRTLVLDVVGSS